MDQCVTLTMLGIGGTGKTTIIHSIINNHNEILPTAGVQISYITSSTRTVLVYDCAGSSMTRSNWSLFSSRADCIGYVIDGANYDRFAESKKNLMKFLEQNRFMRKKSLCVLLNKCDVKDRKPKQLLYKALETEKIAKLVGKMAVKETSAYNKEGLEEFVEWVVKGYGQK